jgi:hypothetical protein
MNNITITGSLFRITVRREEPGVTCSSGDSMLVELEDDENWIEKIDCDAFWLNDLISVLIQARDMHNTWLKRNEWDGIPI